MRQRMERLCGFAYQMPEMSRDHQLQSLSCTGSIASDHRVSRHDLVDRRSMGIKAFCSHLIK